jgi:hypothetical protein
VEEGPSKEMEIKVDQNKPEWKKIRKGEKEKPLLTACNAATSCGLGSYAFPWSLYDFMTSEDYWRDEQEEDEEERGAKEKKHGHTREPSIIKDYAALTGYTVEKGYFWKSTEYPDKFGCSPDGIIKCLKGGFFILECKAPYHELYCNKSPKKYKKDSNVCGIPIDHVCQMQFQMWITKAPWCDYAAVLYDDHHKDNEDKEKRCTEGMFKRVYRSTPFLAWAIPKWLYFSRCLEEKIRPTENCSFYSKNRKPAPLDAIKIVDLSVLLFNI